MTASVTGEGTSATGAAPVGRPLVAEGERAPALHVKWFSRHGFLLHLTVVVVVGGCSVAAWWQATRALSGNDLSWAYTFEWPCFAIYAIVVWWRVLHERAAEDLAAASPRPEATLDEQRRPTAVGRRLMSLAADAEVARAAEQGDWHP